MSNFPKPQLNVSPLLIKVLLNGGIDKDKIEEYLTNKGIPKTARKTLFEEAELYNVDVSDTEAMTEMVLMDSIVKNRTDASLRALDILNKIKGKYKNEVKINSDDPVTIKFN